MWQHYQDKISQISIKLALSLLLGLYMLALVTQLYAAPATKATDFLSDSGAPYERNDPPINFAEDVEDKFNQEQAKLDQTKTAGADAKSEAKAEAQDTNYFDILEFQVEGNTKLTKMQVEAALYPQMGEKKTIADVEKAREALEKAYHRIGYLTVLVDIPEQDVDKKVVKLNVTEGKVGTLRVKDSKYFTLGRIKELSPSVAEGQVPHFPTVQKDIARLNRSADKQVTPVMKAGKKFGTVDVDLKVEDKLPVHASLELNNRYSQDTSPLRLSGMIRYDNLWQREHSLSLNFLTSPEKTSEVQVLSANYLMRFDDSNVLLAMYGVRSNSGMNITSGNLQILGKGTILGARLIKPLPSLDSFYHSISFGLDYKDFEQDIDSGSVRIQSAPVTYMPMSAVYSGTWQDNSGITQIGAGITFGLRGFVADEAEFKAKRQNTETKTYAKSDFFVFKGDLSRTQALPWGFQAFAKVEGQFSGDMLIPNEQYLAGGVDTVRGYLEAQAAGEKALRSSFELRTPSLFKNVAWIEDFKLSGFYDVAQLFIIDPSESQNERTLLSGTGLGMRMKAWKRFNLNLDVAMPLKDYGITKKGDIAGHMRVWYEF